MTNLKDENYVNLQAFMVKELGLKGNDLIIYGIIYGFSQAENTAFTGGLQYLAQWTNSTKQGVIKNLKSLVEKGYIIKDEKFINGVKFCEYRATQLTTLLNKVERGEVNKVEHPIKQSLPNKESNNKSVDNKENISTSQIEKEFNILWEAYPRKQGKANALKAYTKARKSGVEYQTVLDGVYLYVAYLKRNKVEDKYIKHGSTWFNQQCWSDEYKNGSAHVERDEELDEIF